MISWILRRRSALVTERIRAPVRAAREIASPRRYTGRSRSRKRQPHVGQHSRGIRPVIVLTPVLGAAARASCPRWVSLLTTFESMTPVPPITTTFIVCFQRLVDKHVNVGVLQSENPGKVGEPRIHASHDRKFLLGGPRPPLRVISCSTPNADATLRHQSRRVLIEFLCCEC